MWGVFDVSDTCDECHVVEIDAEGQMLPPHQKLPGCPCEPIIEEHYGHDLVLHNQVTIH